MGENRGLTFLFSFRDLVSVGCLIPRSLEKKNGEMEKIE